MSGGSGTQASGPAPIAAQNNINSAFGNTPWASINSAPSAAYSGIQGLNTNPASQYGAAQTAGQNLTTQGAALGGQALGAYQAGQDPQNALYAQQYQQNQDQTNAQNAMSGVASTPYGAALANQSGQNFNLNWQNQQLQREQTAAGTASTLAGAGANEATSGLNLGQSVDSQQYNAQNTQIQDYLNYLLGNTSNSQAQTGATNTLYSSALQGAGLNNTAAQQSNAGLGSALSGLGSLGGSLLKLL